MPLLSSPVSYPSSSSPMPFADTLPPKTKRRFPSSLDSPSKKHASHASSSNKPPSPEIRHCHLNLPVTLPRVGGPFLDRDEDIDGSGHRHDWHMSRSGDARDDLVGSKLRADSRCEPATGAYTSKRATSSKGKMWQLKENPISRVSATQSSHEEPGSESDGKASRYFYGLDWDSLLEEARHIPEIASIKAEKEFPEPHGTGAAVATPPRSDETRLWTEKYRAQKFTDLVGDDSVHREVLRWLKRWDRVVFTRNSNKSTVNNTAQVGEPRAEQSTFKKLLLLAGPPGLGKTTLAHVCARQAGYDVLEINASDERSSQVVKGRIKDVVGSQTVKSVTASADKSKNCRPLCVVVDEVDGVSNHAGSQGEGGFMKTLIELIKQDERNSELDDLPSAKSHRKGDKFRMYRPVILICNDFYHPSIRPLRQSNVLETIFLRNPALDRIASRLEGIFRSENIQCEPEGARKICEVAWGVSGRKSTDSTSSFHGDIRRVLVVAEQAASMVKTISLGPTMITKSWVEHVFDGSPLWNDSHSNDHNRSGSRGILRKVFADSSNILTKEQAPRHAGTNEQICNDSGVFESKKRLALSRLRDLVESSGEVERSTIDCFATYLHHPFQDDNFLSKPNAACDWLQFYDRLSLRVATAQDWELGRYLSHAILGFHSLFAGANRHARSEQTHRSEKETQAASAQRADYATFEASKRNSSVLAAAHTTLSLPISRLFNSKAVFASELFPQLERIICPCIPKSHMTEVYKRPSAQEDRSRGIIAVERAVSTMLSAGIVMTTRGREEGGHEYTSIEYNLEPPLGAIVHFDAAPASLPVSTTHRTEAWRVLYREYQRQTLRKRPANTQTQSAIKSSASLSELHQLGPEQGAGDVEKGEVRLGKSQRDFFGRILSLESIPSSSSQFKPCGTAAARVIFHEGFSNAVRKPLALTELINGI